MMIRRVLSLALALLLAVTAAGALAAERYNMPYYIEVDVNNQIVTVYSTVSKSVVRQMICSTGLNDATPLGTYFLPPKMEELEREYWYYFGYYSCYAHYATRIYNSHIGIATLPRGLAYCAGGTETILQLLNLAYTKVVGGVGESH
jgi:hypothetical protein